MKLVRFGESGAESPGVLDTDGNIRDLSGHIADLDGRSLSPASISNLKKTDLFSLPIVNGPVRLGACVANVGKIICVGLNYSDHAKESGMELPSEPILFFKSTTSICGPNDPIILPPGSKKTDWEVELAVVISERASYVHEASAMDYVAGLCIMNDLSERSYQLERGGQWVKGKSCDSFAPLGPWLVTLDEVADLDGLSLDLKVNGQARQSGSTQTMVFKVPHLVSYISQFMTLEPGDIISTGTPPGVGMGCNPPEYLQANDIVETTITGLGRQHQKVVAL